MIKITLLFITFFAVSYSFGQYSRTINSSESNQLMRHTSMYEFNEHTHFVSTQGSTNSSLDITVAEIDSLGVTSNYHHIQDSVLPFTHLIHLSGSGADSQGNPVITLLTNLGVEMQVHFVKVDLTTNTISNVVTLDSSYVRGFVRTVPKDDSLITYVAVPNGGIERISTSLDDLTGQSHEVVDGSYAFTGNSLNFIGKLSEVVIDGTSEYAIFNDELFKRNSSGAYLSQSIIYSAPNITSLAMCSNSSNGVSILKGDDFFHFDSNLSPTSNGTSEISTTFFKSVEMSKRSFGFRVLLQAGNLETFFYDVDDSFTILDQVYANNIVPHATFEKENINHFIGATPRAPKTNVFGQEGIDLGSIYITADKEGATTEPFIEYNQTLDLPSFKASTGHLGLTFLDQFTNNNGLSYKLNGVPRSTLFANYQSLVGQQNGNHIGYANNFSSTLNAGPYTDSSNYTMDVMDKYNRGYHVTKAMIENHIANIGNSVANYNIPFAIREWPAHGDLSLGQAEKLAPYVDRNGNGVYDPENGDYPSIYGSSCVLNIFHDHDDSNTSGIETHQYIYGFDCDTSDLANKTIYIKYNHFLRSQNIDSLFVGNFMDIDLGSPLDDYAGTNVELGMIYGYNGDAFDEGINGSLGFHDTIPALGLLTLDGLQLNDDGIDNPIGIGNNESINAFGFDDGIIDNEEFALESSFAVSSGASGTYSDPNTLDQYYNIMKGFYRFGEEKLVNGIPVDHSYFGDSDPLFYTSNGIDHGNNNSEEILITPPGDRRIYGAMGPYDASINDTISVVSAYIIGIDTVTPSNANSLTKLFELAEYAKIAYGQNTLGCGCNFDTYISENDADLNELVLPKLNLYPNPSSKTITIRGIQGTAHLVVTDLNGRVLLNKEGEYDGLKLDVSALTPSIYLVQIQDDLGIRTTRLIKN